MRERAMEEQKTRSSFGPLQEPLQGMFALWGSAMKNGDRAWPFFAPPETQALQASVREMIDETQKVSVAWLRRRQEATEASLRSLQSIWLQRSGHPEECLNEWLTKSADLIAAEMGDAQAVANRWADIGQKFVRAAFQLGTEVADEIAPQKGTRSQSPPSRSAAE